LIPEEKAQNGWQNSSVYAVFLSSLQTGEIIQSKELTPLELQVAEEFRPRRDSCIRFALQEKTRKATHTWSKTIISIPLNWNQLSVLPRKNRAYVKSAGQGPELKLASSRRKALADPSVKE
jgi:hypothetical protein